MPYVHPGLRQREDALLRGELALGLGGARVLWRHGFLRSVTILEDPVASLRNLLAHRAGRLIEELAIAATRDQLVAIGELLAARARPSLLRSVIVGPASPDRSYVTRADADWLEPLTQRLPGLVALPGAHRTTAAFEAYLADYPEEVVDRVGVSFAQLAPALGFGAVRLVARGGCEAALARTHAALPAPLRALFAYDPAEPCVVLGAQEREAPITCASLYAALRALAPSLEPARFAITWHAHILEVALADGAVSVRLGAPTSPSIDATADYWAGRQADEPDDEALRGLVVWASLFRAEDALDHLRRATGPDLAAHRALAAHLLDRVEGLDAAEPYLWELRGQLARALGDLDGARRSFLRARELGADGADFALALTAFANRDAAVASAHLARVLAATPQHTAARVLAAHLTTPPAEARAHLEVIAEVVERRRIAMTPLTEQRRDAWTMLEPDLDALVDTGRYRELIATIEPAIGGAAARVGAAAYLFAWAERFRDRSEHPPPLDLTPAQYAWGADGPSPARVQAERDQATQQAEARAIAHALFRSAAALNP
ncbi:MAG: hypothetical protein ABIY55_17395, partial [Kofleriaceae bacterium]